MTASLHRGIRVAGIVAVVVLAAAFVGEKLPSTLTGIDDANIFFVYARNVSAGHGLVFNPGGERVEGFTSLLWVLIAAAAGLPTGHPERLLLSLNIILVASTIALCLRGMSLAWAAAFVLLLLADLSYVVWSTAALMETALFGLLVTAGTLIAIERKPGKHESALLASIAVLLVLTRPEALLWVPVLLGLYWFGGSRRVQRTRPTIETTRPTIETTRPKIEGTRTTIERTRATLVGAIAFVVAAAALTLFRMAYFGFPLPNTYYAKVSPSAVYRLSEGTRYLISYVMSSAVVFVSVLAAALSSVHLLRVRLADRRTFVLTGTSVTGLLVPVLTGGDHFSGFRFYQPVFPVLVLNLLNFLRHVVPQYLPRDSARHLRHELQLAASAAGLGACVIALLVSWMSADPASLAGREFEIAAAGRRLGEDANTLFGGLQSRPEIATITVGGLKYAYDGDVVDLMGLNDTRMAHNGGDRIGFRSHAAFELKTFFELQPSIVVPLVQQRDSLEAVGRPDLFARTVLKGLFDEPRFRERYQLAEVRKAGSEGVVTLAGWYDRGYLAQLRHQGGFEIHSADLNVR